LREKKLGKDERRKNERVGENDGHGNGRRERYRAAQRIAYLGMVDGPGSGGNS
jgi:hypothetical protein